MGTQLILAPSKGPEAGAGTIGDVAGADFSATGTTVTKTSTSTMKYEGSYKAPAAVWPGAAYGIHFAAAAAAFDILDGMALPVPAKNIRLDYVFTTPIERVSTDPDLTLKSWKNTAGVVCLKLIYTGARELYLSGITGGSPVSLKLAAPGGTMYALRGKASVGTATATPFDGKIRAELLLASDLSVAHTGGTGTTRSTNTMNLGTVAFATERLGIATATMTSAENCGFALSRTEDYPDGTDIDTGMTYFSYPYTAAGNTAPSVPAVASKVGAVGVATAFTVTPTDSDGIASIAWTVASPNSAPFTKSGDTTATLTVTPGTNNVTIGGIPYPLGTRYDITCTVTDSLGAATSVSTTLVVPGEVMKVMEESNNPGAWTTVSGTNSAANRVAGVGDTDDATGIKAPTAPAGAALWYGRLAPLKAASQLNLPLPNLLAAAASGVAKVALFQAGVKKLEWNITNLLAPTTSKQTPTLTHANAESGSIGDITDWTALDFSPSWVAV